MVPISISDDRHKLFRRPSVAGGGTAMRLKINLVLFWYCLLSLNVVNILKKD